MNYSLAVFLISDDVRAVRASYEPGTQSGPLQPSTYLFKTFDKSIKVGDYVVVPTDTRHKQTVVRVEEVDVEPDYDSLDTFKWIIGVVDQSAFVDTLRKEEQAIAAIRAAEKTDQRRKLREKLVLNDEQLKTLEITASPSAAGALDPDPLQG